MDNEVDHETYYAQFVDDAMVEFVVGHFGREKLEKAFLLDSSFNPVVKGTGIPLKKWDAIAGYVLHDPTVIKMLQDAGDVNAKTLGNAVCILKTAARMGIEAKK